MKLNGGFDINICYAVTIREQERFIMLQPFLQSLQSAPRLRMKTSIHKVHRPILMLLSVMNRRFAGAEIDGDVLVEGIEIQKVLFDHFSLITESDYEFLNAMGGINFHDVPQDRLPANLDHRFRTKLSLF